MSFKFRIDQKVVPAVMALGIIMLFGTFAYHFLEGWSYIDSLYFTTTTMTTIGYGDLHPTTDLSKLFTIVMALSGVSIGFYALSLIGKTYYENNERHLIQLRERVRREREQVLDDEKRVRKELRELIAARKKKFRNNKYGY